MSSINDLKTSKFLKRSDVGRGMLVTIVGVREHNVAMEGAPEEMKMCLEFAEFEKPMVLNSTNAQIIGKITHTEDSQDIEHDWLDKQIVLYDDPNVSFGGRITGGIRIRASRLAPVKQKDIKEEDPITTNLEDDLPF